MITKPVTYTTTEVEHRMDYIVNVMAKKYEIVR